MEKQAIREYIHQQKRSATPDEERAWGLLQMWNDGRTFEAFDTTVRVALEDVEKELKKPFDPIWRAQDERDAKVYGEMVKWLDEQKG